MDFRQLIREMIAKSERGIELGASVAPILPKADGYDVLVIDHADADGLRTKYTALGVDTSRIEEVDAIDDGAEFTALLAPGERFDYIVVSHVLEHMPDPIHFLQRCERALTDGGKLILLVPDRRFCFDYLRPVSTAGQMLRAYLAGQRRHDAGALYDHYASHATRNGVAVWAEADGGDFAFAGSPAAGYAMAVQESSDYVDCHAWVFTPSSFRLILADLRSLGLTAMGEVFFHGSIGCEFMVVLSRAAAASTPDRAALARQAILEAAEGGVNRADGPPQASPTLETAYVEDLPRAQNAVDLFKGAWVCAFPSNHGVNAGDIALHADPRITWLLSAVGNVRGLEVLELGPLEASHTAMLLAAGARSVVAIEANPQAFLRCLIVKEIRRLRDAAFLLGDFTRFLEEDQRRWPLIVASGVLYHAKDPLRLLEALAARTDTLFLWTHVVDAAAMPLDDPRRLVIARQEMREWRGERIVLHVRPYGHANDPKFCGGPHSEPRWMERDDLLKVLDRLGFADIRLAFEEPDHAAGPALAILARRLAD
ncbi:class I SAM-dependent methyltransferase [Vineibacter terrae]|uniref:Class I SAM-dependent methyltransferase n=1 Tax=Vineibacter terrae TaxID=2586908 RepID=A0A5C8PRW1_9HYPH|nr:methyltransferase domain-containing protein [Vineibacter terrae]TXL78723.1 class I SAM-dependent methyltransferase [Vineibacter terrae]